MKNKYLKYTLKFAFIFALLISCKKEDTPPELTPTPPELTNIPPELTLLGDSIVDLCLGDSFADPGIQSIDAYQNDISGLIDISSNLDFGTVGSYVITYTSTDQNENVSTVERIVNVEICVSSLLSTYNVSHDCQLDLGFTLIDLISENQSILEGNTPNEFIIDNFNTFTNQITGTIDGNTLTIPQNVFSVGQPPLSIDVTISGTGTINNTGSEIIINFTYDAGIVGSGTCTSTYTR